MLSPREIKKIKKRMTRREDEFVICEVFKVLGDWNRYRIMQLLIKQKELCVSDMAEIIGMSMSATSQHLRVMEMSGLVESERMGQMICYRPMMSHPKVQFLTKLMA
jgi:DNA-binding transcriptional ArsR family regulator